MNATTATITTATCYKYRYLYSVTLPLETHYYTLYITHYTIHGQYTPQIIYTVGNDNKPKYTNHPSKFLSSLLLLLHGERRGGRASCNNQMKPVKSDTQSNDHCNN